MLGWVQVLGLGPLMALVALVRAPGEVSRRAQALLDLLAPFTTARATSSALTAAGHRVASGVDKPADQAANPQFSTGVRQVVNLRGARWNTACMV